MFRYIRDCKKRKNCKKDKLDSISAGSSDSDSSDSDSGGGVGGGGSLQFVAGVCCWNSYCNQLQGFPLVPDPKRITHCLHDGLYILPYSLTLFI